MASTEKPARNVGDSERWASLIGGTASTVLGLRRGGIGGLILGALGGILMYRGATGHCPVYQRVGRSSAQPQDKGLFGSGEIRLQTRVSIDRPAEDLYRYWRSFENLPNFMKHLVDITQIDERRSHWVAQAPLGRTVEWDSEITAEEPNERIAWRSVQGSDVQHHGEVRFSKTAPGRATDVEVDMTFRPPGGAAGTLLAQFFNGITREMLEEDINRFKWLMEGGEVPTSTTPPARPSPSTH